MSLHAEEAELGKFYDHRLVRKLWPFLRPYWLTLGLTVLILFAFTLTQVYWPKVFGQIAQNLGQPEQAGEVRSLLLLFAALMAAGMGFEFLRHYLSMTACQRLVADLRSALYAHFQRLPLSYFDRVPGGKVLSRLVHDPNALEDLLEVGFITLVGNAMTLVGAAVAMLFIDWRLALWAFATVPLVVLIALLYRPRMRQAFRQIRALVAKMNAYTEENISGHASVLVLNQEARCAAELDEVNRELRDARIRSVRLHALFPPLLHCTFGLGLAALIWFGGQRMLAGEITPALLITFLIYMMQFSWPLAEMMERVQMLQAAMAALERIFAFLETGADDLSVGSAASVERTPAEARRAFSPAALEFREVWFAYRQDEWVLKGLSFKVRPGECIAIAGPTGAGKTTVLSLASALYRPQRGQVLLNGQDLAQLDPRYVRRQVATVIQDVFLFSDTVLENVRLWEAAIDERAVADACQRAQIAPFIERLPEKYRRKLGQRGGDISVGQRQLLSFARALAFDPPVLILDEATSSVDSETEEAIRQGLKELTRGRTSLIVAHRFSTLAEAERLLVIRGGVVAEETTPREFLTRVQVSSRSVAS